jgi:nucleoid-associated protein YgaU
MTMRRVTEQKPAPAAASPIEQWTIEPGQSLWSVARAHLIDRTGVEPDDAAIDSYWRSLMAANPDASPIGDPDVVYAGTVLVLPPTP